MSYNNQLPVVQNVVVLQQMWLYEIIGVCYWCVKIPQRGYMEYGLKHITLNVLKHIAVLVRYYNPGLVRDKPLGAPHLWNGCIARHSILTEPSWVIMYGDSNHEEIRSVTLYSRRRYRVLGIGVRIINLRRRSDWLRFITWIPIPVRQCLLYE